VPPVRIVLAAVAALVVGATCISLGFWQLGRYRTRTAANRALAAAIAAPPRDLPQAAAGLPPADSLAVGRWQVRGRFDESRQILLINRTRDGAPGVHVVTPLLREDGGGAVLVDRGFVPSDDAATAIPPPEPDAAPRAVVGVIEPIAPREGNSLWRATPVDTLELWATRWLVADSVAAALPYAVAPLLLRELPGEGVPARPARTAPRFADVTMHLSYAGQWFFFGTVALVGPLILARARGRRRTES
jgi:surfeit locus 1 family protein